MWDYLFDLKSQQSPRIKSLPVNSSSYLEDICFIEILFTVFQHTPYMRHNLQLITSLHRICRHVLREVGLCCQSREPKLALQGLFAPFCVLKIEQILSPQTKSTGLPASRFSSLLIREDHMLNRGHYSSLH